ncbi:hypothetical protein ACWEV9_19295 [Streptomyces albogriseolus]
MPRVALTVTNLSRAGVAPPAETDGDPVNHHSVQNNGRMLLLVRNASASTPRTVTLRLPGVVDGQALTPKTVEIPAEESRYIGPFPTGDYGSTLQVDVDNAELKLSAFGV